MKHRGWVPPRMCMHVMTLVHVRSWMNRYYFFPPSVEKYYRKNRAQVLKTKFRNLSSHSIYDVIKNLYYTNKRMNRGPKLGDAASLCVNF